MTRWSWAIMVDPLVMLAVLATVSAAGFEILKVVRRTDKRFDEFQRDYFGEPERPGVARRPGLMERVSVIELHQVDQGAEIQKIGARLERHGL